MYIYIYKIYKLKKFIRLIFCFNIKKKTNTFEFSGNK